MATPPNDATKSMQCRVLIAADDDVLADWPKRRLAVTVPLNMPIRPFLERLICPRLKWENLDTVVFYNADGATVDSIRPTDTPLQVMLTPRQLGWEADSIKWAWMKAATGDEEPLMSAKDLYRNRLSRFYEYYAPDNMKQVDALLNDYADNEELLMIQLSSKYGPEPTPEMLHRKRLGDPRRIRAEAALARAAAASGGSAIAMNRSVAPQQTFGTSELSVVASLMARNTYQLIHGLYFTKWLRWAKMRREQKRIVSYMTGNMDTWLRTKYYNALKRYAETNKTRRQLNVSTRLAFKQESVMGGLSEENLQHKEELRRLNAQVEVLQTNNSRRLEAVFSSTEAAIIQMKLLTNELREKDRVIAQLEQKLLSSGSKWLAANDAKTQLEEQLHNLQADYDNTIGALNRRVEELEAELMVTQDRMEKMRPKTPEHVCRHCPHFYQALSDFEVARNRSQQCLERLEVAERDKRMLSDENASLREQVQQLRDQFERDVANTGKKQGSKSPQRSAQQQQQLPPSSLSRARDDATTPLSSQNPGSSAFANFGAMDTTSAARNVSFALPAALAEHNHRGSGQGAGDTPGLIGLFDSSSLPNNSFMLDQRSSLTTVDSNPLAFNPDTSPKSIGPKNTKEVNLSMASFFAQEERVGLEKSRLSLERQTMPRYNPSVYSTAQPGMSKYRVAPSDPRRHVDVTNSLAYSAVAPGLPGGPTVALDPSRKTTTTALNNVLAEPMAVRPKANPLHHNFETGPTGDARAMRRELFHFASGAGGSSVAPARQW